MKYIDKQAPPNQLDIWFRNQLETHRSYDHDMETELKNTIKQHLLMEQGFLCCYTGIRITETTSHIEHIVPRSLCKQMEGNLDVAYSNLLAAYPKGESGSKKCRFGAQYREDWYEKDLFVTPLQRQCEERFLYTLAGNITVANSHDEAAKETIRRLGLDAKELIENRQHAIRQALYRKQKPLSKAALQRIVSSYCERDSQKQFRPFCFAITQAAQELLHKVERKQKSKQYSQKQGRT